MDSQKIDPKEFINDVQRLCGNLSPARLKYVQDFALKIGDQNKLNKCLKHAKILTNGLPQDEVWPIFNLVIVVHHHFPAEKYIKPIEAHAKRSLQKEKGLCLKRLDHSVHQKYLLHAHVRGAASSCTSYCNHPH